jgi:hypothetical protein
LLAKVPDLKVVMIMMVRSEACARPLVFEVVPENRASNWVTYIMS